MTDVIMVNGEAADVPAILASKWRDSPAAGYVTGGPGIEWTEQQFAAFLRKIRIDQAPAIDPAIVEIARARDFEPGAGGPDSAPAWLQARRRTARFDQSTAYADLSTVPDIINALRADNPGQADADLILMVPRWWLAWWWGRPGHPARAQVLAELQRLTGVVLPPERVWGCQFFGGPQWELSAIYGEQDFDR